MNSLLDVSLMPVVVVDFVTPIAPTGAMFSLIQYGKGNVLGLSGVAMNRYARVGSQLCGVEFQQLASFKTKSPKNITY